MRAFDFGQVNWDSGRSRMERERDWTEDRGSEERETRENSQQLGVLVVVVVNERREEQKRREEDQEEEEREYTTQI